MANDTVKNVEETVANPEDPNIGETDSTRGKELKILYHLLSVLGTFLQDFDDTQPMNIRVAMPKFMTSLDVSIRAAGSKRLFGLVRNIGIKKFNEDAADYKASH